MLKNTVTKAASVIILAGLLLSSMTGCGDNSHPQYSADLIAQKEGVSQVTDKSHEPGKLNDATYSHSDNVEYSYQVSMIDGLLTQKVTKEVSAALNKSTGAWDVTVETLKACEVDATKLPGTSWKCSSVTGEQLESLFGDQVTAGESGTLYIRFLKKMGLFSFNLSNPKNTSTERFFETVGTNVKLVFVGTSGNVEGKASVTGGSVTNAGDLNLDLETDKGTVNLCFGKDVEAIQERDYDEATGNVVAGSKVYVDQLPVFEITTTSISNGEWKTEIGLKEGNLSPALSWRAVDGATKYAVVMIDITTTRWLYWYTVVDKTELAEGEFTDPAIYTGPYPAGTHIYEIHVIALKSEPKTGSFKVDGRSGDIYSFFDYVNTASDGSVGNVLAYGTIKAPYTSPELYYGYR
jgi:hypothetical protein